MKSLYKRRNDVPKKIRQFLDAEKKPIKKPKIHPLRALTHLLDNSLGKSQYVNMRLLAKEFESDIFSTYNQILQTKLECRPPAHYLTINEISASLPLQAVLDHTANRLLLIQEEVINHLASRKKTNDLTVKLHAKWGMDGTSNQARYNKKYEESTQRGTSDENLFATSIVPLIF